jgi:hypothetical protein
LKVDVSYSKPRVLQALRYHFLKKTEIRLMIILVNVFALLSALLFAFRMISPLPFLMGSVLWMTMMVAFWFWLPALIYRKSRTFKDRFTVRIEPDHLFIDTGKGTRTYAWREFSAFFETPGFFHLYFDSRSFFLLPKDGFERHEDVQQARAVFAERIGKGG